MFSQILAGDRHGAILYRATAAPNHSGPTRVNARGINVNRATSARTEGINDLTVVLSASEPHRDVAIRAQILARDTPVRRMALLTAHAGPWRSLMHTVSKLGWGLTALGTEMSARVLRASLSLENTRAEPSARSDEIVRRAEQSDLVIVGRQRTTPWLFAPLARYVRRLLRGARAPVLVVGSKGRGAYRRVVVATDLETDVGPALNWVRRVAPGASVTLLHVYRGPFESKLQWAGVPIADILEHRRRAQRDASARLSGLLRGHPSVRHGVLAHGWASHDVLRKARELGADLTIVVKRTHSWWAELLGASVSVDIAARSDGDVLVVHGASNSRVGARSELAKGGKR